MEANAENARDIRCESVGRITVMRRRVLGRQGRVGPPNLLYKCLCAQPARIPQWKNAMEDGVAQVVDSAGRKREEEGFGGGGKREEVGGKRSERMRTASGP